MSEEVQMYQTCKQCNGTGRYVCEGLDDSVDIYCPWPGCGADGVTGKILIGSMLLDVDLSDLKDTIDDILDKVNDIKEVVDGL